MSQSFAGSDNVRHFLEIHGREALNRNIPSPKARATLSSFLLTKPSLVIVPSQSTPLALVCPRSCAVLSACSRAPRPPGPPRPALTLAKGHRQGLDAVQVNPDGTPHLESRLSGFRNDGIERPAS